MFCCKLLDYCLQTDGMEIIELLTNKQLAYMLIFLVSCALNLITYCCLRDLWLVINHPMFPRYQAAVLFWAFNSVFSFV